MVKLTRSTAVKSPKRQVRSRATMIGSPSTTRHGGICRSLVIAPLLFRKERDEGVLERGRAGFGLEFRGRARRKHLAGVHGGKPFEPFRLFHIGRGDDHAHAFAARAHAIDQLPELPARQRVDAGRRFVEDQEIRIMDETATKPELLPHAAGQFLRWAVGKRRESGAVQELTDLFVPLGTRLLEQAAKKLDILPDAQVRIEVLAQALRHIGDARTDRGPMRRASHVAADDENGPGLYPPRTRDQAQQRGLADPVGPDEPHHAAGRDLDRDVVQSNNTAVSLGDARDPRNRVLALVHRAAFPCNLGGQASCGSYLT